MLQRLIEGLLPGMRSVRAPLIAGMIWVLVAWLLAADSIPSPDSASGFAHQIYSAFRYIGPATAVGIAAILIFVVGATMATLGDAVTRGLGYLLRVIGGWWRWQRQIRRGLRIIDQRIAEAERSVAQLESAGYGQRSSTDDATYRRNTDLRTRATANLSSLRATRDRLLKRPRWLPKLVHFAHLPHTAKNSADLGASAKDSLDLVREMLDDARELGRAEESSKLQWPLRRAEIEYAAFNSNDEREDADKARVIQEATEADPLELLRSVDTNLYSEVDRKRSERELRVAISLPLAVLVVAIAVQASQPWISIFSLIPLAMLVRLSSQEATERTDILRLMRLHRLSSPSLRVITAKGRDDVRRANWTREAQRQAVAGGPDANGAPADGRG